MGGLGSFQLERGHALLAALICLRLVVARSGSWVLCVPHVWAERWEVELCLPCVLRGVWQRRVLGVATSYGCGLPRIESERAFSGMPPGRGKGGGKAAGRGVVASQGNAVPGRSAGPHMSSCPPPPPQDCRVVEILRDLGCSPELRSRLQERLDVTPPSVPPLSWKSGQALDTDWTSGNRWASG